HAEGGRADPRTTPVGQSGLRSEDAQMGRGHPRLAQYGGRRSGTAGDLLPQLSDEGRPAPLEVKILLFDFQRQFALPPRATLDAYRLDDGATARQNLRLAHVG